jgi:hypothetical protein
MSQRIPIIKVSKPRLRMLVRFKVTPLVADVRARKKLKQTS